MFELRMPATVSRTGEDGQPTGKLDRHRLPILLVGDAPLKLLPVCTANHTGMPAFFLQVQVNGPRQLRNTKKPSPMAYDVVPLVTAHELRMRRAGDWHHESPLDAVLERR
jgi:hypothetical protein